MSGTSTWTRRPARLDPAGRLRRASRGTTLRAALVAVLLLTAVGVLYRGGEPDHSPGAGVQVPPTSAAVVSPIPVLGAPGDLARPTIPAGMVGVPVPLAEPPVLALLEAGDLVDLLAIPAAGGDPVPVADGASLLAVDRGSTMVLVSLTESQAREVLSAPPGTRFAVVVRP